jgi:hypothetical protein
LLEPDAVKAARPVLRGAGRSNASGLPGEQVRDTAACRGDIKVSYKGDPWSTVQFEVSPAEGTAGHQIQWTSNAFVDPERLGLPAPGELPLVTIACLVAQKLHACTDHADPERPNDRYRDLLDLILVDRLVDEDDYARIREVCAEIFRLRDKHDWPPPVTVLPGWADGYRRLADQLGFSPSDVHQAADAVQKIIAHIDATRSTA